jgi:hypothetical protein
MRQTEQDERASHLQNLHGSFQKVCMRYTENHGSLHSMWHFYPMTLGRFDLKTSLFLRVRGHKWDNPP